MSKASIIASVAGQGDLAAGKDGKPGCRAALKSRTRILKPQTNFLLNFVRDLGA
jgi:hypothetical protein